eukprot:366187-Chlamydomonas_euryale.AAC.4
MPCMRPPLAMPCRALVLRMWTHKTTCKGPVACGGGSRDPGEPQRIRTSKIFFSSFSWSRLISSLSTLPCSSMVAGGGTSHLRALPASRSQSAQMPRTARLAASGGRWAQRGAAPTALRLRRGTNRVAMHLKIDASTRAAQLRRVAERAPRAIMLSFGKAGRDDVVLNPHCT